MALAANFDKTRKDIEKKLADTGAINAVVGTADLAVKKVRAARAEHHRARIRDRPEGAGRPGPGQARPPWRRPEQLKALPAKAQAVLRGRLDRPHGVRRPGCPWQRPVRRVRGQKATSDLKKQASTTVSHAKATATTAKKSAASTAATAKVGAKKTASTAKKCAAKTKTSAKSTATSAKKTASAAKKAVEDTADKTGTD